MATPLNAHPEWVSSSVDGPGQTTATARSLEKFTVMRFASATARDNAFTAAGITKVAGMVVALDDSPGVLWVWNDTAWRKLQQDTYELAAGSTTVDFNNATSTATVAVSLPAGRFSVAPWVVAQVVSSAGAAIQVTTRVFSVTTSGFSLIADAPTARTATLTVAWQAMVTGLS